MTKFNPVDIPIVSIEFEDLPYDATIGSLLLTSDGILVDEDSIRFHSYDPKANHDFELLACEKMTQAIARKQEVIYFYNRQLDLAYEVSYDRRQYADIEKTVPRSFREKGYATSVY